MEDFGGNKLLADFHDFLLVFDSSKNKRVREGRDEKKNKNLSYGVNFAKCSPFCLSTFFGNFTKNVEHLFF